MAIINLIGKNTKPILGTGLVFPDTRFCPNSGYLRLVNVSTQTELNNALSSALPGDQIQIASGTYTGNTNLNKNGTSANPIVICGNGNVTLKGQFASTGDYIIVNGLVFEGPIGALNQVAFSDCGNVVFTHNEVR